MKNIKDEGIWEMRRKVEKSTGRPVEIYSAYPLIGRGTILHDQILHSSVEKSFSAALSIPLWKRIVYYINQKLVHA